MKLSTSGFPPDTHAAEKKCLNSELWHACAGPLVSLPNVGTRVVYFPQGHSEQVAASTNKEIEDHIPNYPSLPPQLICQLHNVTMHADAETDEVYAQLTLQPLSSQEQREAYVPAEVGTLSKQPTNYFCKTLTASDTSTHGGFSVPRRAAEKVFPPLDFSQQPPAQELVARDLHDVEWRFRHIFRGQPKRHLLTTGWSVFVSAKKLVAGDSVIFIWNEQNQLLLGIRRASRPPTVMPSSVLSSDSMHIGLLAAAAHAAATNSRFTVFYNPRASPSEFVVPFAKYVKAVYHTRVSVGMRFRMLFETEESGVRRYMGTITGISDLDPIRWPNSHWRSVRIGWDESTAGERQPRVSLWEIEPLTTFPMYPSLFSLRLKRQWHPSLTYFQGYLPEHFDAVSASALQDRQTGDVLKQHLLFQQPFSQQYALPYNMTSHNPFFDQTQGQFVERIPEIQLHQHDPSQEYINQQTNYCHETRADHFQQKPSISLSSMSEKPIFCPSFSESALAANQQVSSGSMDGNADLFNLSKFGEASWNGQHQQDHNGQKFGLLQSDILNSPLYCPSYPQKEQAAGLPYFALDTPSHLLPSLPKEIPPLECSTADSDLSLLFGFPGSQKTLCDDASIPSGLQVEMGSGTFVKVYKSGSVGRWLDITRFSSYNELRQELGHMFGIELEDPQRSGWQLVFVDRENDVLLLGDDPWEAFVNNVWYIKILSPEDVQKLKQQDLEFLHGSGGSYVGNVRSNLGVPSVGMLEC